MPILKTKLHRPRMPADYVPRPRLLGILDNDRNLPLVLVSAPAGYGKTTFVSAWMEGLGSSGIWLSLDESDNDLVTFLHSIAEAVDSVFPGACHRTRSLLTGTDVPPRTTLEFGLIEELSGIEEPIVLALEDYGFVKEPKIHSLLTRILEAKIPRLQLVIITRRDPPLPLASLRAAGELIEIRQADLMFTSGEASLFVEKASSRNIGDEGTAKLLEKTEGWAVGLRLASIALKSRDDVDSFLRELGAETRHIQDYLMAEVLSRQLPAVREALLKTSIVDRFCVPLCEALCGPECDGRAFMDRVTESNLFCVPLDERKGWVRYHHLFRELLKRTLERRYRPEEIAALHRQAGEWFASGGQIESALTHFLAAGDAAGAARVVVAHRNDLMNGEEWHRLRRLIARLPRDVVDGSPELLMGEAWLLIGWPEMAGLMARAEALLKGKSEGAAVREALQGELEVMKSLVCYHVTDGEKSLRHARRALESLPRERRSERGLAVMLEAMARQMTGDLKGGFATVYRALGEKESLLTTYHARILLTLCFMSHIAADLEGTIEAARKCLQLGSRLDLAETIAHGHYFLGVCQYERNDLAAAEASLKPVVAGPYIVNAHNYGFSAFAMALTLHAAGRTEGAGKVVEEVIGYAVETGNTALLVTAKAVQAELALRQGRTSETAHWAETFDPDPFTVAYRFTIPQMTLAKWHLANASSGDTRRAWAFLSRLGEFLASTHNRRLLVDVRAMEALLHDIEGDGDAALKALESAVDLAGPGGLVRPFLDLGEPVAELLGRLPAGKGGDFAARILEAFGAGKAAGARPSFSGAAVLPDPLTNRELEILGLLAKRLRNKEIGDRLSISPETVRRHTANIYQKLDVHDRRQAVEKASSLNILLER